MSDSWYCWRHDELTLQLRIQPNAKRDEYAGKHGAQYKIKITAPPVDGKANHHLIRMLARDFGVNKNAVSLLRGEQVRNKVVRIKSPSKLPCEFQRLAEQH